MVKEFFTRGLLFSLSIHENKFHIFLMINVFNLNIDT